MFKFELKPFVFEKNKCGKVDKINLIDALKFMDWINVWAEDPHRDVEVRMKYDDLKTIIDTFKMIHIMNCKKNNEGKE